MERHIGYRSLSFDPPAGWRATSRVLVADPSTPGGTVLEIAVEPRAPAEPLALGVRRKLEELARRAETIEVIRSTASAVAGRLAHVLHVRLHASAFLRGPMEHVVVLVDHGDPQAISVFSMTVLASAFEERIDLWARFMGGVRFAAEAPRAPRIQPHVASFEPPPGWTESVAYTFVPSPPEVGVITVQVEPAIPDLSFATLVDRKAKAFAAAERELLESAPALAIDGRAAHRFRVRTAPRPGSAYPIDETVVVVEGGGTADNVTVVSGAAAAGSAALVAVEQRLAELASSVRIARPGPAPQPLRLLEQGASVRGGLALAGKSLAEVHVELMRKGFLPSRLPLAAATTRAGERRFLRTDGRSTGDLADPRLASELVYVHEDGGTVRIFPDGHSSPGLGGVAAGSARVSVLPVRSRDLSLDAEEAAVGGDENARQPRSVCAGHGLAPRADLGQEVGLARQLLQDTWSVLGAGPSVALPMQDRIGLRLTRTIVCARDFDDVVARVERFAGSFDARRVERDGVLRFFFASSWVQAGAASLVVELGSHVLSVDPIGYPSSVDRLQRCLRKLLRGEHYRVFDDATGTDVTATVERAPSFLVAPTRRPPIRVTSAR